MPKAQYLSYGKSGARALTAAQANDPKVALAAAKRAGGFLWVGLTDPTAAELEPLAMALKLHPLAVSDAITGRQQPKIQAYNHHLFVVMWALPREGKSEVAKVSELFLFLGDNFLITVQRNGGKDGLNIPKILESNETGLQDGAAGALYGVMVHVANHYSDLASGVEEELERLEKQVFDQHRVDSASRIYRLRQEIGKLQRAVSSLATSLVTSREHLADRVVDNSAILPYLLDLTDDLVGTGQLITDQGAALDVVVSSHENNVASQQNDDTRKISAVGALLAVPTVVAGLYGMNFKNLPGVVNFNYGWECAAAFVTIVDVLMFINFKRRGWL